MKIIQISILLLILISCEEKMYHDVVAENADSDKITSETDTLGLIINEISFTSSNENEFGEKSDWIELYNPSLAPIVIQERTWYLTDDLSDSKKFELPEKTIEPKSFLIVWCDGNDTVNRDIHANFKLSSKGESLELIKSNTVVDLLTYEKPSKTSVGMIRDVDNLSSWKFCKKNSPGMPNY